MDQYSGVRVGSNWRSTLIWNIIFRKYIFLLSSRVTEYLLIMRLYMLWVFTRGLHLVPFSRSEALRCRPSWLNKSSLRMRFRLRFVVTLQLFLLFISKNKSFNTFPFVCFHVRVIWSLPTMGIATQMTTAQTEQPMRRGKWPTGRGWCVCCVGGSSPPKTLCCVTSSSLTYTRWGWQTAGV